jgi:hypothetical protein
MRLLWVVVLVVLLACAGQAKMPEVGDYVLVKTMPTTIVAQDSFLVYSVYVGNITDISTEFLCLNSTAVVMEDQDGVDLDQSFTPEGVAVCMVCENIEAILLNSSAVQ